MTQDKVRTIHEGRTLPRLPALDGIRAFAVVLTSLVHVVPAWVPGGIFGVDVFFVLSGFLITSILLNEFQASGGVDLKRFYVRRVRRLLPAVALLLVVFTAVVILTGPTRRDLLVAGVVDLSMLAYVINWIGPLGREVPWQVDHLWSLSVEEQFYLLWPLALIFALRRLSRRQIIALTAALALASSVAQGWTFVSTGSVDWAYEATPMHATGILVGCLLGEVYTWGLGERPLRWLSRREWPAWAAVGVVVTLSLTMGVDDTSTYVGGMFLAVVAAAVLVSVMIAHDLLRRGGRLRSLLSSRLLVAVGKRSYSLYLWQNYMAWALSSLRPTIWYVPANFAATAMAAEISYRFVERRFMGRPTVQPSRRAERTAPVDVAD